MPLLPRLVCGEAGARWAGPPARPAAASSHVSAQLSKFRSPRRTLKATASSLWRLSTSDSSAQSSNSVSCVRRRSPSSAGRGGLERRDGEGRKAQSEVPFCLLDTQLRPRLPPPRPVPICEPTSTRRDWRRLGQ